MFLVDTHRCLLHDHNQHQTQQTTYFIVELYNIGIQHIKQYYLFIFFFFFIDGKSGIFLEKFFFFKF